MVVQPSVYAADNSATLNAIKRMGARARGVAVIDKSTSSAAIDDMAAAGVRGVRLNLQTNTAGKFDADAAKTLLDTTAKQIGARGWHVQFYTGLGNISALKDHFMQLPFPVVFDHFGRASADKGPGQPGFDALLALGQIGARLREDFRRLSRLEEGSGLCRRHPAGAGAGGGQCRPHRLGQPTGRIRIPTPGAASR